MNGYICYYNRAQCEVHADTSYKAQKEAVKQFKARGYRHVKGHQINVVLAEKGGEQVTHTPTF